MTPSVHTLTNTTLSDIIPENENTIQDLVFSFSVRIENKIL
jgi:hypothetical protein